LILIVFYDPDCDWVRSASRIQHKLQKNLLRGFLSKKIFWIFLVFPKNILQVFRIWLLIIKPVSSVANALQIIEIKLSTEDLFTSSVLNIHARQSIQIM
jgi:hypothetical protein